MARPRRFSDALLLDAAARAIVARGEGSWTLADVAGASGMSPAALVKRFGSKAGLLRALANRWADSVPAYEPAGETDPRARIVEWAQDWVRGVADPASARGHLQLLVDELFDDEARAAVARGHRAQVAFLAAALAHAWQRRLLATRPAGDTPELWLDLLNGAAVRDAIDEGSGALRRAVRQIRRQLSEWSHP
jgi:AcrR family transcriptional regulator